MLNQAVDAGVLWQDGLLLNPHVLQVCNKHTLELTTSIDSNYTRCAILAHHLFVQPPCNGGTLPIL